MCFDNKYACFCVQENEALETQMFQATEASQSALFHCIITEHSLDRQCGDVERQRLSAEQPVGVEPRRTPC